MGKSKAYVNLSRGWALGTAGFKATLRADHALAADARAWTQEGARELREAQWEEQLQLRLAGCGQEPQAGSGRRQVRAMELGLAVWMKDPYAGWQYLAEPAPALGGASRLEPESHDLSQAAAPGRQAVKALNINIRSLTPFASRVTSMTDPTGAVTSYAYDNNSNVLTAADALGKVTTYTYDGEDRLKTVKDALNRITTYATMIPAGS